MDTVAARSFTDALRSAVRGEVVDAAAAGYDEARRVWNGAVDSKPAALVRPVDGHDVAAAVRAAREHGVPLSVRGGGHDWAGRAVRGDGLVLDMRRMRGVEVDPAGSLAAAQGGVRAGDLAAATHPHGLAPATGTVKAVGMAGLTLAGGYGPLNGRAGLCLDNLVGAELVLADGTRAVADAEENPDLFWALRGGGANFGVVTGLRYRVHPITALLSGLVLYPLSQAASALRGFAELQAECPDELTVMSGFFRGPDGAPLLFFMPTWSGDLAAGEAWIDRLRRLGDPITAQVAAMPYVDVINLFDDTVVDGRNNEMRTRWVPGLTEGVVDLVVAAASAMTSPMSGLFLHHFHGAATRVGPAETAFALREEHVLVEIVGTWTEGPGDPHRAWARELSTALAPHALPGGYPNLMGTDEPERIRPAYGDNWPRLAEVKRRYDPDGIFTAIPDLTA